MIYYLSTKESQLKSSQLRVPKQLFYSSVINVEVIVLTHKRRPVSKIFLREINNMRMLEI